VSATASLEKGVEAYDQALSGSLVVVIFKPMGYDGERFYIWVSLTTFNLIISLYA